MNIKAVISSTYDDKYFWFIPLVAWKWNRLGINVILILPHAKVGNNPSFNRLSLLDDIIHEQKLKINVLFFNSSDEKSATYSQIGRLYAATYNQLIDEDHLIVSDVDMLLNCVPWYSERFTIWGHDLVPEGQYPMCYARGSVKEWKELMKIGNKSFQECLDEVMAPINCENIKGNYWSLDQELLWNHAKGFANLIGRAKPETQFAANRIDRDDIGWRNYINSWTDAHLWRPGYTDQNFANIMELLQTQYPEDNFQWLIDFRNEYLKLL